MKMRCHCWLFAGLLVFAMSFVAGRVCADDAGTAKDAGVRVADAGAADARAAASPGPVDPNAPIPKGHPAVDEGDEEDPHGGNPHAAHPGGGNTNGSGIFQPPEDGATEDPKLPAGTIEAQIADPDGKPRGKTEVTLGIIINSVAKGESRKRVAAMSDDKGVVRFSELETGTGIAYRVMVLADGATFSAPPFQLSAKSGMKALLHVYPVEREVEKATIVTQSMIYVEVKDDRVQIQEAFKIYNFGKSAWVPNDLVVPLPPEFTAFTSQQGMTDVGIDAVPKKGAKIRGTFTPGAHVIEFRWQLPYAGEADVGFDIGMTPNMAASRVIAPAGKSMGLEVEGFPPPQTTTDGQGQRALVTEKQMRRDEPALKRAHVVIKGLPTEGPAKIIATLLAGGTLALGLVLGVRKPVVRDVKGERKRILEALAELERAHAAGDIGPKTYERMRREIIDEVARTFAVEPPKEAKPTKKKPRASA